MPTYDDLWQIERDIYGVFPEQDDEECDCCEDQACGCSCHDDTIAVPQIM